MPCRAVLRPPPPVAGWGITNEKEIALLNSQIGPILRSATPIFHVIKVPSTSLFPRGHRGILTGVSRPHLRFPQADPASDQGTEPHAPGDRRQADLGKEQLHG